MSEPVNPIFRIEGVFMTDLSRLTERDSEIRRFGNGYDCWTEQSTGDSYFG